MSETANPLSVLTNDQLFTMSLLLKIACNRAHSPLKGKRKEFFCAAGRILDVEANLRGVPIPTAPFTTPPEHGLPAI